MGYSGTGSVARRELLKSKLPSAELGKIWRLADTDREATKHSHIVTSPNSEPVKI